MGVGPPPTIHWVLGLPDFPFSPQGGEQPGQVEEQRAAEEGRHRQRDGQLGAGLHRMAGAPASPRRPGRGVLWSGGSGSGRGREVAPPPLGY